MPFHELNAKLTETERGIVLVSAKRSLGANFVTPVVGGSSVTSRKVGEMASSRLSTSSSADWRNQGTCLSFACCLVCKENLDSVGFGNVSCVNERFVCNGLWFSPKTPKEERVLEKMPEDPKWTAMMRWLAGSNMVCVKARDDIYWQLFLSRKCDFRNLVIVHIPVHRWALSDDAIRTSLVMDYLFRPRVFERD